MTDEMPRVIWAGHDDKESFDQLWEPEPDRLINTRYIRADHISPEEAEFALQYIKDWGLEYPDKPFNTIQRALQAFTDE